MGRCIVAFNFRQPDKILEHFAMDEQDVSVEIADEGLFVGPEAVKVFTHEFVPDKRLPGEMIDIQLTSPIIEVADDLKTARTQWVCPGIGAIPQADGDPQAIWIWGIIGADFINKNGVWKIWHLHWFRLIKCKYELGWVRDLSMINRPNKPVHPLSRPTTYHNPYTPHTVRECIPAVPRPYSEWVNDNWMLNKDKSL